MRKTRLGVTALERREVPALADFSTTFNGTGKRTFSFSSGNAFEELRGAAVQPDGKIVVAGSFQTSAGSNDWDFGIARLLPNGEFDTTFDGDGKTSVAFDITNSNNTDQAQAVAIQPDGKIVVVGRASTSTNNTGYWWAITRLNANGTRDGSFGDDGKLQFPIDFGAVTSNDSAQAVAIAPDGKIVIAGRVVVSQGDTDFAVVRLNTDGTYDSSFSGDGKRTVSFDRGDDNFDSANAVAVMSDGRIVVAGQARVTSTASRVAIARLTTSGNLDSTFGTGGRFDFTYRGVDEDCRANAIALRPSDNFIYVGGTDFRPGNDSDFGIARVTAAGGFDTSFSGDGKAIVTFDIGGDLRDTLNAMFLQPDGRLVLVGSAEISSAPAYNMAVARLNPDGGQDNTFGEKTYDILGGIDFAYGSALLPSGDIVLAGNAQSGGNYDMAVAVVTGDSPAVATNAGMTTNSTGKITGVIDADDVSTSYVVNAANQLYRIDEFSTTKSFLAGGVTQVSAGLDLSGRRQVYVLFSGGNLWKFNEFAGGWSSVAGNVAAVQGGALDTAYVLFNGGNLWRRNWQGWSSLTTNVAAITAGADVVRRPQVFVLFNGGSLWQNSEINGWSGVASNVKQAAAGGLDNVWVVFNGDFLWRRTGTTWTSLTANVATVEAGRGSSFAFLCYVRYNDGNVWQHSATTGGWSSVTGGAAAVGGGGQGTIFVVFSGGFLWRQELGEWDNFGGGF